MSKTSDNKVSELQKEVDKLKTITGDQQLRIQELRKITAICRKDCVLRNENQEKIVLQN